MAAAKQHPPMRKAPPKRRPQAKGTLHEFVSYRVRPLVPDTVAERTAVVAPLCHLENHAFGQGLHGQRLKTYLSPMSENLVFLGSGDAMIFPAVRSTHSAGSSWRMRPLMAPRIQLFCRIRVQSTSSSAPNCNLLLPPPPTVRRRAVRAPPSGV